MPAVHEVRMSLNLSAKELVFLQKVTRQEYHFITEDEQQARLRLRDKLVEAAFDQEHSRITLSLSRDELLFLIKVARENYSFIVARGEGSAPRPRRQAAQDRGVGLRRDHQGRLSARSLLRRRYRRPHRPRQERARAAPSPAPIPTG